MKLHEFAKKLLEYPDAENITISVELDTNDGIPRRLYTDCFCSVQITHGEAQLLFVGYSLNEDVLICKHVFDKVRNGDTTAIKQLIEEAREKV